MQHGMNNGKGSCVQDAKTAGKELPDITSCSQEAVRCKKCSSPGAIIHIEEWTDGLIYSDYSCRACGFSEVF